MYSFLFESLHVVLGFFSASRILIRKVASFLHLVARRYSFHSPSLFIAIKFSFSFLHIFSVFLNSCRYNGFSILNTSMLGWMKCSFRAVYLFLFSLRMVRILRFIFPTARADPHEKGGANGLFSGHMFFHLRSSRTTSFLDALLSSLPFRMLASRVWWLAMIISWVFGMIPLIVRRFA